MIVLDEHISRLSMRQQIEKWYSGKVCYLADLRPGTIIKDDNIPAILMKQSQPTFITINVVHFWKRIDVYKNYCMICFAVEDRRVREIPLILKKVLHFDEFKTKALRMGKMIRISDNDVRFYGVNHHNVTHIQW